MLTTESLKGALAPFGKEHMVKLRALRATIAMGAKHEPGTETEEFYATPDVADSLERRGICERVHEKMQKPVENKMAAPAENKETETDLESLTKRELIKYAAGLGIELDMRQKKAEMLRALE